jgi:hypothetical protein
MVTRKALSTNGKSIALLVVVLACAHQPGGMASPPSRIERVHVESQHTDLDIASKVEGSETRAALQFPALLVWQALPRVYADLAIPTESVDPGHRFLAGAVSARRAFAGKPLSYFVDCGSSVMGPTANSYNVRLHIQTQVDSVSGSESTVRSLVNATAANEGGNPVRCASRGDLERLIVDRLGLLLR